MTVRTRSREELLGLLLTLPLAGLSYRVIAHQLGVSRHTVRRLLAVSTGTRRHPRDSAPMTSSPDEGTTT